MTVWPVVMPSLEDLAETAADITPVRGDLLVVNSSTVWDDFAVGAAGSILTSDGTDPAWDTTPVISGTLTLSGMTQGSVLFLGSGGLVSEDNTNLFWDDTNNRLGIGTNAPTHNLDIHGHMEMTHVADEAGDHAIEIDLDAAGFGDTKGLAINYVTGSIGTGKDEAIILLNINEISAAGGDISGLEVLATSGSADLISGLKVGVLVGPILQSSGAFINPTTATNDTASTQVDEMKDGDTGTNTTIFVLDDDFIIIGAAAAFGEIEFVIETGAANPGIKPTFGYSTTGSGQFTTFSPVDGTNGFRSTGVVAWEADDLTGHTTNDDTGTFDIKITRTHAVAGSVSLFYAKTAATDVYKWDKDGKITCNDLTIGIGKAGVDYKITFDGESKDGALTWLEDEDQFSFDSDIVMADNTGMVIGHTAQIDFGAIPEFQVLGTGTSDSSMGFARFEDNASGPDVRFLKSRSGTIGTNVIVQDNDTLGRFRFQGADGIDFNTTAAEVLCRVNGTPTGNDIPGEIVFRTRAAAGSLADRLIIDNAGVVSVLTGNLVMTDNSVTGINSLTFTGVTGAIDNSGSSLLFTTATIATLAWTWVVPGVAMAVQNTTDAASNQIANFFSGNRATAVNNDEGFLSLSNDDDLGAQQEFSRLTWKALDVVNDSKDGQIELATMVGNSMTDLLTISGTGITVGAGVNGIDYTLTFHGNFGDGIFTYMEDEDRLDWDGSFDVAVHAAVGNTAAVDVTAIDLTARDLVLSIGELMENDSGDMFVESLRGDFDAATATSCSSAMRGLWARCETPSGGNATAYTAGLLALQFFSNHRANVLINQLQGASGQAVVVDGTATECTGLVAQGGVTSPSETPAVVTLRGIHAKAQNAGNVTDVTTMIGVDSELHHNHAINVPGTTTLAVHFNASYKLFDEGTVTDAIQFRGEAWPSGATFTNGPYGLSIEGTSDLNWISGKTKIGASSRPTSIVAELEVNQQATGAAIPVLTLDQDDVSEPFIDFVGTSGSGVTNSISSRNTSGATTDHIQIDLNGVKAWIAVSTNDPT